MSYSREEFDEVLKMTRSNPVNEGELVLREFTDIKEVLKELKEILQ